MSSRTLIFPVAVNKGDLMEIDQDGHILSINGEPIVNRMGVHSTAPWEFDELQFVIWDATEDVSVAEVHKHTLSTDEERIGNGKLLAAAPDLLHACSVALGDLIAQGIPEGASTYRLLKAAISKATGGTV